MACKKSISLPSGFSMPALGFGTWQAKDDELDAALDAALAAGYRHIDTAWIYENEHVVGKVIKRWLDAGKVKRDELFIVTKLPMYGNRPADVEKYLKGSLEKLQLSYVDLYLIHGPVGYLKPNEGDLAGKWVMDFSTDHLAIWKEMEKQVDSGRAKAIGVSNFNIKQVDRILNNCRIPPVTNQVELHVYYQQPELVNYLKSHNVTITSYSTLGTGGTKNVMAKRGVDLKAPNLMENPIVVKIAEKHRKTPAQVLLRNVVQKGIAAIPKSTNPERIKQNINVFDFELDADDIKQLESLDRNEKILAFDKIFKGIETHPECPY